MSKSILIPMDNFYPFGKGSSLSNCKILVKKQYAIPASSRQALTQNIKILQLLKHDCLIKIQSIQEDDHRIYVTYQYVHTPIENWYQQVNREFIDNYEQRLILFSRQLVDLNINTVFQKQCLGVNQKGEGKFYLNLNFQIDPSIDKASQKKAYKEEIKKIFQYYIDKKEDNLKELKNPIKTNTKLNETEGIKKQNTAMLKILEAIEKTKATLNSQKNLISSCESGPAKLQSRNQETKQPSKNVKDKSNAFTQKEINSKVAVHNQHMNRHQHILLKLHEKDQEDQDITKNTSFQFNQEKGEKKKLNRFEEVQHKQYKNMKTSGQFYVQDFLDVLESDQVEQIIPPMNQRSNVIEAERKTISFQNDKNKLSSPKNVLNTSMEQKASANNEKVLKHPNASEQKSEWGEMNYETNLNNISINSTSNASELQRKVEAAIANSLSAISKFKKGKS